MSLKSLLGRGMYLPNREGFTTNSSTLVIDATGERIVLWGPAWASGWVSGTRAVRRVIVRLNTCVSAEGSGWTVGLAAMDDDPFGPLAADQTVAVAAAAVGTGGVWLRTGTLSTDRTVSPGDIVAVTIEFDGSGRQGSDSMVVSSALQAAQMLNSPLNNAVALYIPTTWTSYERGPIVILECDDGSYITLDPGFVGVASSSAATTTTGVGADFTVEETVAINALWAAVTGFAAGEAANLVLYSGNTRLQSVAVDGDMLRGAAGEGTLVKPIPLTILHPGTAYHVGVEPTAGGLSVITLLAYGAAAMALMPGGAAWKLNTVTIATPAWGSPTATTQPLCGVRVAQIDDGTGSRASSDLGI